MSIRHYVCQCIVVLLLSSLAQAERVASALLTGTSKKYDNKQVYCLMLGDNPAGVVKNSTDFTKLATLLSKQKRSLSRTKSGRKKLTRLNKEFKLARELCRTMKPAPTATPATTPATGGNPIPFPTATGIPAARPVSLEKFDGPFDVEAVQHLLRRTTYGPSAEDAARASQLGLDGTVDWLLQDVPTPDLDAEVEHLKDGDDEADHDYTNPEGARMVLLQYARKSPNQFKERMAFFWHDLFAASHRVLDWGEMHFIFEYFNLCRTEALGNIKRFARAMTTNGMMLTWLDGRLNRSGQVNENFAREFWELFSLGKGNYTERDVHEAARSYTGWTVVWSDETQQNEVAYLPQRRDNGEKVLFEGTPYQQRGNFGSDDVVRLTFDAHPNTPRFYAHALYLFLVGSEPTEEILTALAAELKANDYELRPTLSRILRSKAFFAPQMRFNKVRTPVTYLVSFFRTTGLPWSFWDILEELRSSGQDPLNPPSVKGWDDNEYWLNQQWLLTRMNLPNAALNYPSWKYSPFSFMKSSQIDTTSAATLLNSMSNRLQTQIPVEVLPKLSEYLSTYIDWEDQKKPFNFATAEEDDREMKARGMLVILSQLPLMQRE